MTLLRLVGFVGLAGLAIPLHAASAAAQEGPTCRQVRPGLVRCTATEISGHTPSSFYLLSRSPLHISPTALRPPDSLRAIRRSVRIRPF